MRACGRRWRSSGRGGGRGGPGAAPFLRESPRPGWPSASPGGPHAPGGGGRLGRGDGGAAGFLAALAEFHVRGGGVDWVAVLGGGERVELPTYAFRRRRFWPERAPAVGGAGAGSVAEARFWAAVEGGDVGALAEL